ncbi:hypothetical protein B0H67DRAFT_69498 [Lasiosphaeris hirsuta]|uniref:BRCT domain-containing protein n=1 Tax=Lasiosphaeris hirsuta TaxID=260670 RepID=A0AA40BC13_9PEZI|nr:hypothetical protein B0H67DRAFT_69498 [Lasiosphaeris hirsuta]
MDPQSPPKRITRARAAAKGVSEPASKSTRIVTAAAKAKATRSTGSTLSTATKRKTRADDVEDSDHEEANTVTVKDPPAPSMKVPRARGRPKKMVAEAPEPEAEHPAPVKATRGRPRKTVVEPAVQEPAKPIRTTRAKKITNPGEQEDATKAPKRTTRGRPPSSMAMNRAAKPVAKKTVKFEEPEKENIVPPDVGGKTSSKMPESATGLKAKPIRKPGTAVGRAARSTRGAASSENEPKPIPLSPKKVNQMAAAHVDSDDELAPNDKAPTRPLRKNPIKPSVGHKKPLQEPAVAADEDTALNAPDLGPAVILGSPIRKPPPSPWKNSIRSPAKRVEGVLGVSASQIQASGESTQSPFKASLLQSPAKRPPPGIKGVELGNPGGATSNASPFKTSLLLSPAKRAFSPMKSLALKTGEEMTARTPAPKATLLATPLPTVSDDMADADGEEDDGMALDEDDDDVCIPDSPTRLRFPGRLSAVLPRHADPALSNAMLEAPEIAVEAENDKTEKLAEELVDDPMALDEPQTEENEVDISTSTTPPVSPPKSAGPMFRLRERDPQDYDSETDCGSEDELAAPRRTLFPSASSAILSTPYPVSFSKASKSANDRVGSSGRSTAKRVRMEGKFGFTPLADQLTGWTAGPSPLKTGIHIDEPSIATPAAAGIQEPFFPEDNTQVAPEASPMQDTYFDEAMIAQSDEMQVETVSASAEESPIAEDDIESPVLEDIPVTEEDVALAAEAHEMSLMEPEEVEEIVHNRSFDDSLSEASQEYGDENEVPIDPTLLPASASSESAVPLVTPQRALHREFHTVSKVPLKPADDSTPRRIKKRSHSISRLHVARPTYGITRSASVISYSPMKSCDEILLEEQQDNSRSGSAPPPVTPTKSEAGWSTMGTPARTPRRDIDPALLRGAVVFVDVHTSEGADASSIFVELLGQMGARCVKSWSWNPTSPPGKDAAASKVGITHVVYKDGGKRTLEKVRESNNVVQCVGVSWVLDCERENQWLDEAPYYIDTSLVPRGGARRRKSMEPRAIANLNGMLIPTPTRNANSNGGPSRGSQTAPSTPANGRRASALWVRTPEDNNGDEENDGEYERDDQGWTAMLTPVPKTPAPEAIARFAANISPATPSDIGVDDEDQANDDARQALMMRTCPPKPAGVPFFELGQGVLGREKDERVLMRLMAARRKSLQFAPKVGSPLARAWN